MLQASIERAGGRGVVRSTTGRGVRIKPQARQLIVEESSQITVRQDNEVLSRQRLGPTA